MSDEIPEPWRTAAQAKGVSATYRPLALAAGLSHETVRKAIKGRKVSASTKRKLADALGISLEKLHEWRREAPPDFGREFVPDASSVMLTSEEREAVNVLIRLLARDRAATSSDDVVPPPAAAADRASVTEDPPAAAVVDDPLWTEYNATRKKSPAKGDE